MLSPEYRLFFLFLILTSVLSLEIVWTMPWKLVKSCRRKSALCGFISGFKTEKSFTCPLPIPMARKKFLWGDVFFLIKGLLTGLGLTRMDRLVEKYNGYLTRASEDGGFTTEILLPLLPIT